MEGKESLERIFAQLSDEQKEQFKNCKDIDEVMKLANEENVELTDEQLEFLASGGCGDYSHLPVCKQREHLRSVR